MSNNSGFQRSMTPQGPSFSQKLRGESSRRHVMASTGMIEPSRVNPSVPSTAAQKRTVEGTTRSCQTRSTAFTRPQTLSPPGSQDNQLTQESSRPLIMRMILDDLQGVGKKIDDLSEKDNYIARLGAFSLVKGEMAKVKINRGLAKSLAEQDRMVIDTAMKTVQDRIDKEWATLQMT